MSIIITINIMIECICAIGTPTLTTRRETFQAVFSATTVSTIKPRPNDRNISTQHIATLLLYTFGHPIAMCCHMLRIAGSSLKVVTFFGQHFKMFMTLYLFGHVRATLLRLIFYFKAPRALSNMSQNVATG